MRIWTGVEEGGVRGNRQKSSYTVPFFTLGDKVWLDRSDIPTN
jgi:hypothetical protein